jgi:hypothetical protein
MLWSGSPSRWTGSMRSEWAEAVYGVTLTAADAHHLTEQAEK